MGLLRYFHAFDRFLTDMDMVIHGRNYEFERRANECDKYIKDIIALEAAAKQQPFSLDKMLARTIAERKLRSRR